MVIRKFSKLTGMKLPSNGYISFTYFLFNLIKTGTPISTVKDKMKHTSIKNTKIKMANKVYSRVHHILLVFMHGLHSILGIVIVCVSQRNRLKILKFI